MKVLLINGSPHKDGSTAAVLAKAAEALERCGIETEIFWIGAGAIGGCRGCYACKALGRCVIEDSVNECAAMADRFDGFIFGSSVHFGGLTGNMTSFMDRFFYSLANAGKSYVLDFKPAASLLIARRAGTVAAYDQINKYFGIRQMPIISSIYWNSVFGANAADIQEDGEGLYTAEVLAENMAYYLKCIEAGREKGLMPPSHREYVRTNFIR